MDRAAEPGGRRAQSPAPPPNRRRRLRPALWLAAWFAAGAALADAPAEGRYRCYLPPAYTVLAWFDLAGGTLSVNGEPPLPVRADPARGRLAFPAQALPPWRVGLYFPPGADGGDAQRTTIVLAADESRTPGGAGWATLPRCYLTTH